MAKYTIDTNVYLDSFRDAMQADALKAFLVGRLPETLLHAVVMQELRVGARTPEAAAALQADVFDPFERRGRAFAPSVAAFKECGRVLADLITKNGLEYGRAKLSLANDVLIATSCREQGIAVITNDRDFEMIRRHVKGLRVVAPWP